PDNSTNAAPRRHAPDAPAPLALLLRAVQGRHVITAARQTDDQHEDSEDRPRWRVHMRLLIRKLPPRRERSRRRETTSLPPPLAPSHPLHATAARADSTTTDSD